MAFRIAQDDAMEAVLDCADDTNSRRLRGLKEGATFGEAIVHFFRDEPAGRREFLVRDHLNKAHAAKQIMAEIKAWAVTGEVSRWPGSVLYSSFPSSLELAASLRESPLRMLRLAGGSLLRQDTVRILFRRGGVTTHAHRIPERPE
jgi:hypothetical protein